MRRGQHDALLPSAASAATTQLARRQPSALSTTLAPLLLLLLLLTRRRWAHAAFFCSLLRCLRVMRALSGVMAGVSQWQYLHFRL